MFKDVGRIFHFAPTELSLLYLDRIDLHGLMYWHDDALAKAKEIKAEIDKAKKPKK